MFRHRATLAVVLPPLLLTGALSILFAAIAGISLGTVIGGLFAITLVLPPLSAGQPKLCDRFSILACCAAAVAATWICLVRPQAATIGQWCEVSLVMAAYAAALAGCVALLDRLLGSPLSSAITILIAFSWLTWPIWLSPWMATTANEHLIDLLVLLHPPLLANGILTFTAPWTEQSLAYTLTVLGQDIPIALPDNPLPSIGVHVLVAAAGFALASFKIRKNRRS
ncbi:MAG TPA: hypothetical protein VMD30_04275 [Tepidisphaeraceae bacterium]|nr:hypothetical protein [Tepidisphaeraceae bacterium]